MGVGGSPSRADVEQEQERDGGGVAAQAAEAEMTTEDLFQMVSG